MSDRAVTPLDLKSCRILTVSSSLDHALHLIDRIRSIGSHSEATLEPSLEPSDSSNLVRVPWSITNKYYAADVHFAAHPVKGLAPYQLQNIPALVFVWAHGEDYRSDVERLAGDLSDYEPEVSLAVRIQRGETPHKEAEEEEDGEIDEFLSSHGFEFVDATKDYSPQSSRSEDGPLPQAIPRLPRVIDALSTIMWPSMKASSNASARRKGDDLLDLGQGSRDSSIGTVESLVTQSRTSLSEQTRIRTEMADLELWLEEDTHIHHGDPWKSSDASSGAVVHSPTDMTHADKAVEGSGFDDDFTVFVSAPPADPEASGSSRTDSFDSSFSSFDNPDDGLATPHAGDLYRTLGSTPDLGDLEHHGDAPHESRDEEEHKSAENTDEGDGDGDLPTEEEIQAVSNRIFGLAPPSTDGSATKEGGRPEDVPPSSDEYDMAPFDLSRVMSALRGMKAEIATMEDEGEKRKAAAKVALGLVYGLEAEPREGSV